MLSLHYVLESVLRFWHVLLPLSLTATLWGRYSYGYHLIYMKTEVQIGCLPKVTWVVIKDQGLEFSQTDPAIQPNHQVHVQNAYSGT